MGLLHADYAGKIFDVCYRLSRLKVLFEGEK